MKMKNINKILWGTTLIAVGGIIALNAFGIADIELFFDGWWTLFIIVPCLVGIYWKSRAFNMKKKFHSRAMTVL